MTLPLAPHIAPHIAIDTGGTFTDCVFLRDGKLAVLKLFSTPEHPARAVLEALRQIAAGLEPSPELGSQPSPEPGPAPVILHGTTVGTNTLIERKGARVAFVTTQGFADSIAICRQARAELYNWFLQAPEGLVPDTLRFAIPERTSSDGEVLGAPSSEELHALQQQVRASGAESIALSLLFSFTNPQNEQAVMQALQELGLPISASHRILPEFREYERAATVAANAYLAPRMQRYLLDLEEGAAAAYPGSSVHVMQSSGGMVEAKLAAEEPVRTVLSGPAGGVMGAFRVAIIAGFDKIIGFDMGGTSSDVCLVDGRAGGPRVSNEAVVSGIPIAVPMLNIHTVGAGGGSLARFDAGGMLRVGPESAGADPGPICFGRGTQPTVTDANLVLGRLDSERFLGGAVPLDTARARAGLDRERKSLPSVEAFALGIVRVAEAAMEKAIRVISVAQGHDPRDFTLVAFGGGGPLHACALARALRIPRVLVPCLPGALSALGILLSDSVRDYSRTVMRPIPADDMRPLPADDLDALFAELEQRARAEFPPHDHGSRTEPMLHRSVDLRYRGQGYELNVPFAPEMLASFHTLHASRYGFSDERRPVEAVNLRVRAVTPGVQVTLPQQEERTGDGAQALVGRREVVFDNGPLSTAVYERDLLRAGDRLSGPVIIVEYSSTTVVPAGDVLRVDGYGNLLIEVQECEMQECDAHECEVQA